MDIDSATTVLRLRHPQIIENTIRVFRDGEWIQDYSSDAIRGEITLSEKITDTGLFIVYYKYLADSLPVAVGPLYQSLPLIDNSAGNLKPVANPWLSGRQKESGLVSSGTVFRNLGVSPLGGTDFSGGLQFQIQGDLGNDMHVSGTLTDRDVPIQPEGNTQSLEEIDKILIQVSHPNFTIEAGDIDYNIKSGNYLNINRKLIGLKHDYHIGKWQGTNVFAGSEGEYNTISIKGEDGRQGPYFLTSKTGNRDVVVLAGTERIWLDGELLTRGETMDYIIDYNRGEVIINPNHLVHFDTDLYFEYQYSDFSYTRNVLGTQLGYGTKENFVHLGWYREKDVFSDQQQSLAAWARDSLKQAGDRDIRILPITAVSDGRYVIENGVYVFWELAGDTTLPRYNVVFEYDGHQGSYIKKVSAQGRLYFEFITPENRDRYSDFYSPGRSLKSPVAEELFQLHSKIAPDRRLNLETEIGISRYDRNHFSPLDDSDNNGLAYSGSLAGEVFQVNNWKGRYALSAWGRSTNFHELSRDRDPRFDRIWNTKTGPYNERETMRDGTFSLLHGMDTRIDLGKSRYVQGADIKNRSHIKMTGNYRWVPGLLLENNQVTSAAGSFSQTGIKVKLLPGSWHPIVDYSAEQNFKHSSFEQVKGGLNFSGETVQIDALIGSRTDFAEDDTLNQSKAKSSESLFGELDVTRQTRSGWGGSLRFRKRILTGYTDNIQSMDYNLGQAALRYSKPESPLRLDLQLRTEQTFSEQRAVVYDSVGVGLGMYRYDAQFNEYIPDPNGAYIAYQVYTGERKPVTHFESLSRLRLKGSKTPWARLTHYETLTELKVTYDGEEYGNGRILFDADLTDTGISHGFWQVRQELYYRPISTTRSVIVRHRQRRDLNGTDPRGNDLKRQRESEMEWNEPLVSPWRWLANVESHDFNTRSSGFLSRNRSTTGWWLETGPLWSNPVWQVKTLGLYGRDAGEQLSSTFNAFFSGLTLEITAFFQKTSRLNWTLEWVSARNKTGLTALPPEANRGLPLGNSLKTMVSGEIRIGSHLSLIASTNFIRNQRYDNFIMFNGELRAFF